MLVDDSNVARRSTDGGLTWTSSTLPSTASWKSAYTTDNTWVAIRANPTAPTAISTDNSATWTATGQAANTSDSVSWNHITYGNGKLVTLGTDHAGHNNYSSNLGASWTASQFVLNSDVMGWKG